jgi:cytochrome c
MKNTLGILSCCLLFGACSGDKTEGGKYYEQNNARATTVPAKQNQTESTETSAEAPAEDLTAQNFEKGAKLIAFSDCLSCHQENEKLIGPAYTEVAKNYEFNEKNTDYLAGKIIKGGKGVWGQVPMTPHPDIAMEDAREMAKYILSLRKQ